MQTLAIIISMIVAVAIGATISADLGILIGLSCVVYQVMLVVGRSARVVNRTTVGWALFRDIVRNGVFLLPFIAALLIGSWLGALASVAVFGVNLSMS